MGGHGAQRVQQSLLLRGMSTAQDPKMPLSVAAEFCGSCSHTHHPMRRLPFLLVIHKTPSLISVLLKLTCHESQDDLL
jgi:hypothetical protein